jgi:hypothetical protein
MRLDIDVVREVLLALCIESTEAFSDIVEDKATVGELLSTDVEDDCLDIGSEVVLSWSVSITIAMQRA